MHQTAQPGKRGSYTANLLGNIRSHLAGLQGYDVMALELIQNADDAKAEEIVFDITRDGPRGEKQRRVHVLRRAGFQSMRLRSGSRLQLRLPPHHGRGQRRKAISKRKHRALRHRLPVGLPGNGPSGRSALRASS